MLLTNTREFYMSRRSYRNPKNIKKFLQKGVILQRFLFL